MDLVTPGSLVGKSSVVKEMGSITLQNPQFWIRHGLLLRPLFPVRSIHSESLVLCFRTKRNLQSFQASCRSRYLDVGNQLL